MSTTANILICTFPQFSARFFNLVSLRNPSAQVEISHPKRKIYIMSDSDAEAVVTVQPKKNKKKKSVKVEAPEIDMNHLLKGNWTVKHLDCFSDVPTCLFGWCCPCLLMWRSAEKLGENPLLYCLGGFCFPMMVPLRVKTREKFGIESDIVSDTLLSGCCCASFSNCQVANELKKRGL